MTEHKTAGWIGASLLRKEDARHLYGHGMFIADVQVPGVQDIAFVRSPMANARVRRVVKPADSAAHVFTLADIGPINVLEAGPELSAHRHSPYPPLADGRVRYVGQTIAACVMPTRAQAEDVAEAVQLELDELPAVVDVVAAMRGDSQRVFDEWPSNAYISTSVVEGDPSILAAAPVRLHRRLRLNRQATVSMEGRGALAYWDHRLDELVVYLSTQGGQLKRMALSRMLGVPENKVRVIAPDVGGGFGGKNRIMPEDVAVAALALKLRHPVRWIEDRREHLLASPHARDHTYDLTICAERDGTLLGLEGDIYIDAGAYALWPTGAFQEASMASRNLTGPYRMRHLKLNAHTVATNKAPMGPYRGVARPGATFALERLVDEMARELKREPFDLRRQNIVTSAELPYRTAAGMKLDTGDYVAALDIARDKIDLPAIRKRQAQGEADGRRIGVGFAFYTEQSGHGIVEFAKRKFRVIPGYESANIRMLPDGGVLIYVGVQNHGQGHETTLAQIAAHELGIDPAQISVRYGDTAVGPYGFGTFASRSIVFAGGAVGRAARALAEKIRRIGAHLLQADAAAVRIEGGMVHGPSNKVGVAEIAFAANARPDQLPAGMEPLLETTATYEPSRLRRRLCLRHACGARRCRARQRRGRTPRLRGIGRLRHDDQSDDRRRPGGRRHRAGHRHRALRGDSLQCPRPAARRQPRRLSGADGRRNAVHPHRASHHPRADDRIRRQGPRRRRRHRAAGRDRQRGGRCVRRHRREFQRNATDAAPRLRGDRRSAEDEGGQSMRAAQDRAVTP